MVGVRTGRFLGVLYALFGIVVSTSSIGPTLLWVEEVVGIFERDWDCRPRERVVLDTLLLFRDIESSVPVAGLESSKLDETDS